MTIGTYVCTTVYKSFMKRKLDSSAVSVQTSPFILPPFFLILIPHHPPPHLNLIFNMVSPMDEDTADCRELDLVLLFSHGDDEPAYPCVGAKGDHVGFV